MKRILSLILVSGFFAIAINANAQIKILTGGVVSVGSTNAPLSGYLLQVHGKTLFSTATSGTNSAALIKAANGFSTAGLPDYTWLGNEQTGFFHPDQNKIGVSIGNTERFQFNGTGFNSYGNAIFASSSGSSVSSAFIRGNNSFSDPNTPDYSWVGNEKTGIFHPNYNIIGFTIQGKEKMRLHSDGKLYLNSQPNTVAPWQDGLLTIKGATNTNDRGILVSVDHATEWVPAIQTEVTRPFTTSYHLSLKSGSTLTSKFFVTGAGWLFAGGAYFPSDRNLKEDISPITNSLNIVKQLKGVKFKWIYEKEDPATYGLPDEYFGFVAQEVEEIFQTKAMVRTMPDGVKAIQYHSIIPFLVEAIKELTNKMETEETIQNSRIDSLELALIACCTKKNGNNGHRLANTESNTEEHDNQNIMDAINQTFAPTKTKQNTVGATLAQNVPNPFNRETTINYTLPNLCNAASIIVFDMQGKLLKTYSLSDNNRLTISAKEFLPGMYMYCLVCNNTEIDTKKMIITE